MRCLKVVARGDSARASGGAGDGLRLAEDLHLDSLGRVQLQSAVEQRFGWSWRTMRLRQVETVGELREMVERELVLAGGGRRQVAPTDSGGEALHFQESAVSSRQSAVGEARACNRQPPTLQLESNWYPAVAVELAGAGAAGGVIEAVMRPLVWLLARRRCVSGRGRRQG